MSIWGDADASKFSDNPFHVAPNWYLAVSVECYEKEIDVAEGQSQLVVKWKIKAPGTEYDGLPVPDRKTYWKRDEEDLDGEQRRANSFLKMMLRNAFDLTPDELNNFTPKDHGLNREAMIEVTNNPDKNNPDIIYNNIRSVMSRRLYEERYGPVLAGVGAGDTYGDSSMISDI